MESSHSLSGNPAPSSCRGLTKLTAEAPFAFVGLPDRKKTAQTHKLQMMPNVNVTTEALGVVVIPNLFLNLKLHRSCPGFRPADPDPAKLFIQ